MEYIWKYTCKCIRKGGWSRKTANARLDLQTSACGREAALQVEQSSSGGKVLFRKSNIPSSERINRQRRKIRHWETDSLTVPFNQQLLYTQFFSFTDLGDVPSTWPDLGWVPGAGPLGPDVLRWVMGSRSVQL